MSKISNKNIEKIKNEVLYVLFESKLSGLFTKEIADEVARDDEFILGMLKEFEKNNIIKIVNPPSKTNFIRRKKWIMTEEAYKKYKELNL
ncbi:hypothetical protein HYX19_02575 [Candidatus Woesearchaeota archaeon]|nr:hypothetical protein [Candidatus Woesearchaeota archaeon]